jgi:hypothetical protein
MKHADNRPRVHLWPHPNGIQWTFGPCATPNPAVDHGDALNRALERLGPRAAKGVVVIVEPAMVRQPVHIEGVPL